MKQIVWTFAALMCLTTLFSCDNGETYADMKEKEKLEEIAFYTIMHS